MNKAIRIFLAASFIFSVLICSIAIAQRATIDSSSAIDKLVIGTTDQVEDINVNDGIFNTYREAFLTKSLIRVNPSGDFVPSLAESWETDDAQKWVFHLVKNATWHDGKPVTAEDIKFSLEYLPAKLGGSNWDRSHSTKTASFIISSQAMVFRRAVQPQSIFAMTSAVLLDECQSAFAQMVPGQRSDNCEGRHISGRLTVFSPEELIGPL